MSQKPQTITKPKYVRQKVESIPEKETVSSVFAEPVKGRKTSPKSNMATVGSESSVSSVFAEKPVKGRKTSPKSNRATVGSESSVSDSSSDNDSSVSGIPGSSVRSVGMPDIEEEIEEWKYLNILTFTNLLALVSFRA